MLWLLFSTFVWATPYSGIPVNDVPEFGTPYFQSHESGWYTHTKNGLIFIYVGLDDKAAAKWFEQMTEVHKHRELQPYKGLGDEALHSKDQFVLARYSNIGLLSWCNESAEFWIHHAMKHSLPGEATPPEAPKLAKDKKGIVRIQSESTFTQYIGGQLVPLSNLEFTVPPKAVIVWDELGRSTIQHFNGTDPIPPPEMDETSPESSPTKR